MGCLVGQGSVAATQKTGIGTDSRDSWLFPNVSDSRSEIVRIFPRVLPLARADPRRISAVPFGKCLIITN